MRYNLLIILIALGTFILSSCSKKSDGTEVVPVPPTPTEVSPSSPNDVSQVLIFPGATTVAGASLPVSSPATEAPLVSNLDMSISYTAGGKIVLPADVVTKSAAIKGVYIQVKGADKYFDLPINTTATSALVSVPFDFPSILGVGTFTLILKFYDADKKISLAYEVTITVTKPDNCGKTKVSGGHGLTSNIFTLGSVPGKIKISYETFVVKDKIDIFQKGVWIGGTGPQCERSTLRRALNCSEATESKGYVGQKADFLFNYDPSLGTDIEVVVSGCEAGGTKWEYTFSCPNDIGNIKLAEITTAAVSAIEKDKATSGGNISSDNGSAVTARGVVWATQSGPTVSLATKTIDGKGTGSFVSNIAGLSGNTKYYVRAYATNALGTAYGNELSFTTSQNIGLPVVSTSSVTAIAASSGKSGGSVTADNGSAVTARGVVWSTQANPTIALTTKTSNGSGTGAFTSDISALSANTKYYLRAYATNAAGTAYGSEVSFTTLAAINLTLDGKWATPEGLGINISGTSGIFYSFSDSWKTAEAKGLVKLGDTKLKNIAKKSTYIWQCLEMAVHRLNGAPYQTLWSEDGTITMASDGKSFSLLSSIKVPNSGTQTSSTTYTRQ